MSKQGTTINQVDLTIKDDGKLISLAVAKETKDLKIPSSTEFIAGIAAQLGMPECISIYMDRAYIKDSTIVTINSLIG